MKTISHESLIDTYRREFSANPDCIINSPGRVNLIGEHTDYNDGFVLPIAIDQQTTLVIGPNNSDQIHIKNISFNETINISLTDLKKGEDSSWHEYIKAIVWSLQEDKQKLIGFNAVMYSTLPMGAGLSSSASFLLALARAFSHTSGFMWKPKHMALLAQKAENKWVGVNCGIMDQMICAIGAKDHAVLIDCLDLEFETISIPKDVSIVIMDTMTRRELVESKYNERRTQCEEVADFFKVKALRNVTLEELYDNKDKLDPTSFKRAHHVISENERVLKTARAMQEHDINTIGELMNLSHKSLDQDFEVTNKELNEIVKIAQLQPDCYGARMSGAGFGGCAVALIKDTAIDDFCKEVKKSYLKITKIEPELYVTKANDGCNSSIISS
jgi:galactokinase